MISVNEATQSILSHPCSPRTTQVELSNAIGQILAERITADRDLPPFDRVTMDGIAVQFATWKDGQRTFSIESMQAAGEPRKKLMKVENAIEVMTGAMLPIGTDTVVRYEDLDIANGKATIKTTIDLHQSIHKRAQDAAQGQILLEPGIKISSAEVALLASVGKSNVQVFQFPSTAIIGSGDELVDVASTPLDHQIRRSNTYAIQAAMREMSWPAQQFHIADDEAVLTTSLCDILERHDVLVLSGGVSKGKFDFIPAVLEKLGVKKIFHQVKQRPGKPFWFGITQSGKTVFALPGNPVSTFMCFYRYIRPWILTSLGCELRPQSAILAKDFSFEPSLTFFLQVSVRNENGRLLAFPDAGGGSGDFANLKKVDGFLELPAEKSVFKEGESYPFIAFRL